MCFEYIKHDKHGVLMLYVFFNESFHSLLKPVLGIYVMLRGNLESKGITIMLYDQCITNKKVDNNRILVIKPVDILKISDVCHDLHIFSKCPSTIYRKI